jgi:hypothetical protein
MTAHWLLFFDSKLLISHQLSFCFNKTPAAYGGQETRPAAAKSP